MKNRENIKFIFGIVLVSLPVLTGVHSVIAWSDAMEFDGDMPFFWGFMALAGAYVMVSVKSDQ